jgi:cytosine/adenosine deaminase-related metal-dependent hydrolase
MGADDVLSIQIANNAKIANTIFGWRLGELSKDALADIVILDYFPPTPVTLTNFPWHLMFGISSSNVDTTIINGKVIMRDRKLVGVDEQAVCSKARALAEELWERV